MEKIGVGEGLVHMDVKGNGEGNGEEKPGKGFTDFLLVSTRAKCKSEGLK